ncbi:hypothetical protein AQUCO_00500025v1 [Aquilegia coerulea]|uniref:Uncharacterized protein n=1 Tax=Aquilegia coerulea TaxID=218851 RepID=A0A2G5EPZ0_AQUCA|nr:hypothetical protein AQUCO_00500025v1 [Aquilegia coerulea]
MMPNSSGAVSDDASSGSGSSHGGGGGGNGSVTLKKGPWTAAEDAILIEYVRKHGEGNWNAVQKNSGLSRCGKSCRLRWANHLRPNLKKGSFSPEEERLILELHAKLGNKWARMAAQLPGRTDNEIKNYWNTRVKRRQRAGLPLYPQDIQKQASSFHLHQNNHHHQNRPSQSSSPSMQLTSSQQPKTGFITPLALFDSMNYSTPTSLLSQHNNSYNMNSSINASIHNLKRFRGGNNVGSFNHYSSRTPTLPSSGSLYTTTNNNNNNNYSSQLLPAPNFQFDTNGYDFNSQTLLQNCFESNGLMNPGSTFSIKQELPSSQISQAAANAHASDNKISLAFTRSNSNSGLLEDLLQEAEAMGGREHARKEGLIQSQDEKRRELDDFLNNNPPPSGSVFNDKAATPRLGSGSQWDDSSSNHSSAGVEIKKEATIEMNHSVEDDDLSSLLNILPSTMMVSDLYNEGAETSNGQSSVTDEDMGLDMQHHLPSTSAAATTSALDNDWTLGVWNNLPGMSC